MKKMNLNLKKILGIVFIAAFAFALQTKAYFDMPSTYPTNLKEPINLSTNNQTKGGGLTVNAFIARGNSQINGLAKFNGEVQQSETLNPDTLQIGSDTKVRGEIHTAQHFNSQKLVHSDSAPKPLCNDAQGNIIFCDSSQPAVTAITLIGNSTSDTTSELACGPWHQTTSLYYQNSTRPQHPEIGTIYYTDEDMNTRLVGDGNWYRISYDPLSGVSYAVKINTGGTVISSIEC